MANIWKAQSKVNNKIKRNNHDLSKKSNISLKFGTLYPVFCKKVFPGDSFSIDTAFNLKLQPVIFPVQTKMRAHMHYFYVRNKNLWSGWEDWITGLRTNEETPHPYLKVADADIKTSSIHDFLGVPTSVVSNSPILSRANFVLQPYGEHLVYHRFISGPVEKSDVMSDVLTSYVEGESLAGSYSIQLATGINNSHFVFDLRNFSELDLGYFETAAADNRLLAVVSYGDDLSSSKVLTSWGDEGIHVSFNEDNTFSIDFSDADMLQFSGITSNLYLTLFDIFVATPDSEPVWSGAGRYVLYHVIGQDVVDYSDLNVPLFSRELLLNALPYRAYESIYNAFYRNTQVDPLIINGRTEYNKFVENMGDGADNFNYHLHQRNYELDFLTSALPSPQQGVAPLVGMTALGDITIEDENGITTAKATVADDGTITDVVVTSPAASVEHQRVAMSLAQFGMNIQDFRNANAYLRLLETSIRKGYRYIENILGHWGVAPKHNTLDMPEFIGGFSRDVQVSTVVSSADTLGSDGLSLGDYGGYAQLVGGSKSPVRHFCDDHGFIIGILSVVPTPCYSQLLPKQMIAPTSYLDYYFPEFDQIGYQPITYKEVAPIQSYLDSLTDPNKRLEDTFGYQRPNYDLVGDVDEVHGLFRTDFRNYVINRIFDTRPELGHDFISINPSEINQIFVDTNPDEDVIIGEIGFAVHTKRPVSRVVIPGLGH